MACVRALIAEERTTPLRWCCPVCAWEPSPTDQTKDTGSGGFRVRRGPPDAGRSSQEDFSRIASFFLLTSEAGPHPGGEGRSRPYPARPPSRSALGSGSADPPLKPV